MTREDIIQFAKECSTSVYELCINNPFFNTTECPIGANGLSDIVLNAVLNAFPKTQELASIQEPQGLDEAAEDECKRCKDHDRCFCVDKGRIDACDYLKGFKAGAKWQAEQGVSVEGKVVMDFSDPAVIINRRLVVKLGDTLLKVEPGDVRLQITKI